MNIDICNKKICYLLGFFWADCYFGIDKRGYYSFSFEIKSEDFSYLWDLLRAELGFKKFSTRFRKNSKKEQSCIGLYKQGELDFFARYKFDNKDSGCPLYFDLSDECKSYFIKGFLDGDGSVSLDKNNAFRVSFNGSKGQSWDFVEDFLASHEIHYNIYRKDRISAHKTHKKKIHGYSVLEVLKNENKIKFCELLSDKNIGVTRKLDKFNEFLHYRGEKGLDIKKIIK
tara:strand:+ start:59 stop:742 length:684 start_codon:yes stop_codon:yes gene_type:complete